jgi:hypothetical protein
MAEPDEPNAGVHGVDGGADCHQVKAALPRCLRLAVAKSNR